MPAGAACPTACAFRPPARLRARPLQKAQRQQAEVIAQRREVGEQLEAVQQEVTAANEEFNAAETRGSFSR